MLVVAPIAMVTAICYALLKLNGDSELVVMNAAGISPRRTLWPVLAASIVVALFVAYIAADLAPRLQRRMDFEIAKVRTDVVANIVRPGAFISADRALIFHIRERTSENQFRGIFIDDARDPDERTTIVAEYGQIVQRQDEAFLVMRDGNIQRRRVKERDPTIVLFDQYAFDLTRLAPAPQVNVGLREMFLWDLAFPPADDPILKSSPAQFRIELHDRLIAPLYPLAFCMIAFVFLGFPRTTRESRTMSLFAVIAGVAGLRLGGFAASVVAYTFPPVLAAIYAMIALTVAFGAVVVWRGVPLDLDNRLNFGLAARSGLIRLERLAARFNIRLPAAELLRRLERSE
jgi:lipopolysaccharide export system permease protein